MRYQGTIVGKLWSGSRGYTEREFVAPDDETAIALLRTSYAGDFQAVIDVECWREEEELTADDTERIIRTVKTRTLIRRLNDEAEDIWQGMHEED